jgi:hypothetical protein
MPVAAGIMADESAHLLRAFFEGKRLGTREAPETG